MPSVAFRTSRDGRYVEAPAYVQKSQCLRWPFRTSRNTPSTGSRSRSRSRNAFGGLSDFESRGSRRRSRSLSSRNAFVAGSSGIRVGEEGPHGLILAAPGTPTAAAKREPGWRRSSYLIAAQSLRVRCPLFAAGLGLAGARGIGSLYPPGFLKSPVAFRTSRPQVPIRCPCSICRNAFGGLSDFESASSPADLVAQEVAMPSVAFRTSRDDSLQLACRIR